MVNGVEKVGVFVKEKGVKCVIFLVVSGLFYFSLMKLVVEKLCDMLEIVGFSDVKVLVIVNVIVKLVIDS